MPRRIMGISVGQVIREQLVAAMEKRAVGLDGEARRVLDERLAALRVFPADELINAAAGGETPDKVSPPSRGPLGELVDSNTTDAPPERADYPELPALESFRALWSGIRSDSQLQQAVVQSPTNAGPLNSAALVSRSIALMRELSPEYLRQFLAYVDDLEWLEQVCGAVSVSTAGAASTRTRMRSRSRK